MDVLRFKDDRGHWFTSGLFYELAQDKSFSIYTIKEEDIEVEGKMYLSLKKLYLEDMDPTEYLFAEKYLGCWNQWQRISSMRNMYSGKRVKEIIQGWRDELRLKIKALAIKNIMLKSLDDKGYQAAKYLADAGWDTSKRRGKDDAEVKKVKAEVLDDAQRLGLKLVK